MRPVMMSLSSSDTGTGSPGMVMQTFVEAGYEFRVAADVQATGNFLPLPTQHSVPIVPGPTHHWRAVLPTLRRPGEAFQLAFSGQGIVIVQPSEGGVPPHSHA